MNYLHEYSTFDTVEELNESMNEHINRNQYELNGTDRDIFLMLGRYAVKYKGASHLKAETIARTIGKSIRTVQRSIRKMEGLGMVESRKFIRNKSGGNGANIYLILAYNDVGQLSGREESEEPTQTSVQGDEASNESILFLSSKDIKRTYTETSYSKAYARFIEAFEPFMNVGSSSGKRLISRLYGVFLANTRKIKHVHTEDELSDVATRAIHATMHASKRKRLDSIIGYFTGVVRKMLNGLLADIMRDFALNAPAGDWSTPLEGV